MSADTAFRRAQDASERGDLAAAETAWSELIDAGDRLGEALKARALARAKLGNWGAAADDLERWYRQDPDAPSPLDLEYARVLRTAQSLPPDKAVLLLRDFNFDEMAASVSMRLAGRFVSIDDFITRSVALAADKYSASPPEVLKGYLAAKIPARLYRVPALQALPAMDMWARCEWWVYHGLGAADAVHELVTGSDESKTEPQLPAPPYRQGTESHHLAVRCPVPWAFVHHALLVMAYDLAEELADEQPQVTTELPAIRDAAVKPLLFLGFGIGLESQGV